MRAPGQIGRGERRRLLPEEDRRPGLTLLPAGWGFSFIPSRSRRRPRVAAVLRPHPPRTHLAGHTSWRRPRPPPGAGGTRAGGRPPAGATGGAARERAGGAGRARPSAAGRSRVAAGSDTCRAPPPQPPRPLARPRSGTQPRPTPRRADSPEPPGRVLPGCCSPSPAAEVLAARPVTRGKSWQAGRKNGAGAATAVAAAESSARAGESWKITCPRSALTKRALPRGTGRGAVRPTPEPPGWAPQPRGSTILKGGRSLAGCRVEALGGLK